MSKYTKGPWRILKRDKFAAAEDRALQLAIDDGQGMCVAWLVKRPSPVMFGSDEANAALIAAAPDMLAFIKAQECHCEDSSDYGPQACERCVLLAKVERP